MINSNCFFMDKKIAYKVVSKEEFHEYIKTYDSKSLHIIVNSELNGYRVLNKKLNNLEIANCYNDTHRIMENIFWTKNNTLFIYNGK